MAITGDSIRTGPHDSSFDPGYSPIVVRTSSIHRASRPAAFDCIRIIVVRDGYAFLYGGFGKKPVSVGQIAILGADVRCTMEPEGYVTSTVIFVDPDYIADQMFWQYAHVLHDRLDAKELLAVLYSEPAQILKIGEERVGLLMPWLDEMAALSTGGDLGESFLRMQALWFSIADTITPNTRISKAFTSATRRPQSRPILPRSRRYEPMREEALVLRRALKEDLAKPWKLSDMAALVHLSTKQLTRVFRAAFGKTPQAYLTMMRVEEMARLLRETDVSVADAGRRVGWRSRSRATEAFWEYTGRTPQHYREAGMMS